MIFETMSGVMIDEIKKIQEKLKDIDNEMKNTQTQHYFNYLQGKRAGITETIESLSIISDELTELVNSSLGLGEE